MSHVSEAYDRIIQSFVDWAQTVPDIRGAIIIGSRARTQRPADDWSDLDLVFFTTTPETYLASTDWLDRLGPYWVTFLEKSADGQNRERRVLFANALDVDFVPLLPGSVTAQIPLDPFVRSILQRGYRIVLDKDGTFAEVARRVQVQSTVTPQPPDEVEFLNVVNDFWYHTVWTAKKLRRGELWMALGCVNGYMKWGCLLPVITWHARTLQGRAHDTWMNGRFLEHWADPRVVEGLRATSARYEFQDAWQALFGMMELWAWLAPETAAALGYSYPGEAAGQVREWVHACYTDWQAAQPQA